MRDIVKQLNDMYDGLNLTLDENTGQLNLNEDAVYGVISANKDMLMLDAYSKRRTELYEEQVKVVENLENITKKMSSEQLAAAENFKNGEFYQKSYNEAMKDGIITTDEFNVINKAMTGFFVDDTVQAFVLASMAADQNAEAVINATEAYDAQAEKVITTSDVIKDATGETSIAWSDLSDTQKAALEEMGTTQEEYTAMSEEDLQGYIDTTREQQEEMKDLLDERIAVTQNAFEKIESTIDVSLDKMIENLESNQKLVSDWTDNLAILTDKGLNEGFIQVLEDTGVDAAATVAGLVDASDEEIQRLNDVFMNGSTVAIDSMRKELGLPTTVNVGSETISDIADKVEDNTDLTNAAKSQVKDVKKTMVMQVNNSNFSTVGSSMVQGMINGMNSLGGRLRSTARSLAKSAYRSMKEELDEHSPSKKTMEIGRFFVGGLINGIDEMSQNAVITVKALSSNIVNALAFDTIQTPSMSDFDTINSPQMSGLSPMSTVMQNTTNTSSRENNVTVKFTGPVMLGNEMDVEKVSTMLAYYLQDRSAAQGA